MSKESERVVVHETRGEGIRRFKRVDIRYADGQLFYSGWIQDFEDGRTGPTVFEDNYEDFDLDDEEVHQRPKYWTPLEFDPEKVVFRDATVGELDELIDLNFQNYFAGGYNRISSYQGLNLQIDEGHTALCAVIDNAIYGFLYIDWVVRAPHETAYFDNLFCAPAIREKGIGHKLIATGLSRAKDKGFKKVAGQISGSRGHCRHILQMLEKHEFEIDVYSEPFPGWFVIETFRTL